MVKEDKWTLHPVSSCTLIREATFLPPPVDHRERAETALLAWLMASSVAPSRPFGGVEPKGKKK